MKLHPRTLPVQKARAAISEAVWNVAAANDLTYAELAQALNEVQAQVCKYMIRVERHPDDPEKRGDEE